MKHTPCHKRPCLEKTIDNTSKKKKNRSNPLGVLVVEESKEWKQMVNQVLQDLLDREEDYDIISKLKYENKLFPPGRMFSSDLGIQLYFHKNHKKNSASGSTMEMAMKCVQVMNELIQNDQDGVKYPHFVKAFLPKDLEHSEQYEHLHPDRIILLLTETPRVSTTRTITHRVPPPTMDQLGCPIIYVDQYLIIVDKPANVLSVDGHIDPTQTPREQSIESKLRTWYTPQPIYIVHRLDMETSGLLMIALTRTCAQALNQMFRTKKIQKKYIARIDGHLVNHNDQYNTLKTWIQRHPTEKLLRQVVPLNTTEEENYSKEGTKMKQIAETRYKPLDFCPQSNSSWVELMPVTGQTHQLRVHMNYLGHAIWGDSLYASDDAVKLKSRGRLCLHAFELTFCHPITQEKCIFQTQPINPFSLY